MKPSHACSRVQENKWGKCQLWLQFHLLRDTSRLAMAIRVITALLFYLRVQYVIWVFHVTVTDFFQACGCCT